MPLQFLKLFVLFLLTSVFDQSFMIFPSPAADLLEVSYFRKYEFKKMQKKSVQV